MKRRRDRHGSKNRSPIGEHNVIDDITGLKHRASEMRKLGGEQQGLITHFSNWNPPHPQLKIRSKADKRNVKDARPRQDPVFVTDTTKDDL